MTSLSFNRGWINWCPAVFAVSGSDISKSKGEEVKLVLKNDNPINLRNYRTPLKL